MRRLLALALVALLPASCTRHAPSPGATAHYVLGAPYQAGGVWRYPHEQYDAALTGVATVYSGPQPRLTADGEAFDPEALAVAHPTLQLPAIARLTDLETGRQVTVRVNDRGPAQVGRLIAVTPRVARVLGFPANGLGRVRLDVLPAESHGATDGLPDSPRLAIAPARREAVRIEALNCVPSPLDKGNPPSACGRGLGGGVRPGDDGGEPSPPPDRLPQGKGGLVSGQVTRVPPAPGRLYVALSRFADRRYAARQAARLPGTAAGIVSGSDRDAPGYRALLGPFATIGEADAVLDQALRAGVTDARIVVE